MIKMGDDGNVFYCTKCFAEVKRTRNNPMPEVKHKKECPDFKKVIK